jgi:hypothetical protein
MIEFRIGDRVALLSCSHGHAGTVLGIQRGKVAVRFDDLDAMWVLRPTSLERVSDARG